MVKERRNAWAGAKQTARQTYAELRDQMDLKQKQANVSEARSSRKQAEASARHGRIILLFTVVTIIFLPMSFLTSWFSMNANDLNNGKLDLGFIAAIIFPISIAIAVFALALAFSETWRNFVAGLFENVIDFILGTSSGGTLERSRRRTMELRERAMA
jgi:membrane protein YqaA with SNARE-associated domain